MLGPTEILRSVIAIVCLFMVFTIVAPGASAQRRQNNQSGQRSQPGVFDYYLLNLSWEPEFCHSRRNADSEECQKGGRGFVIHGLWPQFANGYPEHCSDTPAPGDLARFTDFMPTVWLAQHEWSTHGTCSGLSPEDYFGQIHKAFSSIRIPDQLARPERGFAIAPSDVKQAFVQANPGLRTEDMAVSCGNNYLTAVEFCLTKDSLKPMQCGQVRDCRANVIRVGPVR